MTYVTQKLRSKSGMTILMLLTSVGLIACAASTSATGNPVNLTENPTIPEKAVAVPVSPLSSDDLSARLDAIESRVSSLENDMANAKPILAKVDVIERQFRSLSLELDRIDQESGKIVRTHDDATPIVKEDLRSSSDATTSRAIEPKSAKQKASTKESTKSSEKTVRSSAATAPAVTNVRFGNKNNASTRIVVDATRPVRMTSDLDNQEKILVLEIKGLDWKTVMNRSKISSPLVTSYTAQNTPDGSRLVLQLKRAVQIGKVQTLGPEGNNGHRAFIDLSGK